MTGRLEELYNRDLKTWDGCADTYETHIVGGHPDILAFEEFEEDMLDRMLRFLIGGQDRKIRLMDLGCGSGRLHVRYGLKTSLGEQSEQLRAMACVDGCETATAFDPVIAGGLGEVWGVDFSKCMIELAEKKLASLGLKGEGSVKLALEQGSAFDLEPQPGGILPLAICLVNSIGVMQGHDGAAALFDSMRRAVEKAGGIAIVSCYQQRFVESYALGQYESTMDVSGQPAWLVPDRYASEDYKKVPRRYKLAHSEDDTVLVDVYDAEGELVEKGYLLKRDPDATGKVISTGDISTHSDYRSHWYSFAEIDSLIEAHWGGARSYHIETADLDILRAEAAQMAVFDPEDRLGELFGLWKIM